jgi:hypothetical protein
MSFGTTYDQLGSGGTYVGRAGGAGGGGAHACGGGGGAQTEGGPPTGCTVEVGPLFVHSSFCFANS